MVKELLHTDSLDNIIEPSPIIPVPTADNPDDPVHRGLGALYKIEAKLALVMRIVMFFAMIALGLLMFSQVFMRYVVSSPFLGIEELAPMLALWIYFMGMSYCTRERDHIEGGVMALLIKKRETLLALRLFGTVACIVAVVVFAWYAWEFTSFNISVNRKSAYMRLPKYIWDFSMVIGFALMLFYLILQAFLELRALITRIGGE